MSDENKAPNQLLPPVAEKTEENYPKAKSPVAIAMAVASNNETAATAKNSPIKTEHQHPQDNDESEEEEEEEYCYSFPREEIRNLLESIEEPGNFVVSGMCKPEMTMPGLFVDGIGLMGLPLSDAMAEQLSKRCEQAPFGRGADTLVDTTVRNTKQLGPQSFSLKNPQWETYIENITDTVAKGLGVQENIQVEAELYKLLLYEKGSFFTKHRDSEKTPGMFGTLVVVLPSQFKGGQLVVDHKKKNVEICQEANSAFSTQYTAFYADCRHELKQVTEGHRLCLVYNLVKKGGPGPRPSFSDESVLLKELRPVVKKWAKEYYGEDKLVIMTEHLYTPAGMSEGIGSCKYKGKDALLVDFLERAQEFGVDICYEQGTLSYRESGYAKDYGDYYSDDYEWMETTETHLTLTLLNNVQLSVTSEEIVPEDYLDNAELIDETFEPTGNEGVNAEREYSDKGAIVVFPKSQRWATLADYDGNKMSKTLLSHCSGSHPRETLIEQANLTIDCFSRELVRGVYRYREEKLRETLKNLIKPLHSIGDETVIKHFTETCSDLNSFTAQVDDVDFFQKFAPIIESGILKALPALYKSNPNDVMSFAVDFVIKSTDGDDATRKALMTRLSAKIVTNVVAAMQPNLLSGSVPLLHSLKTETVKSFLSIFLQSPRSPGISNLDCPKLVHDFITAVTWASCQNIKNLVRGSNLPIFGPRSLVNTGIRDICLRYGWQQFEQPISDAVQKLVEHRSIPNGISLAYEISFPLAPQGVQSEQHRTCAIVASQVLTEACLIFVKKAITNGDGMHHSVAPRFFALCDAFMPDLLSELVPAVNAVGDQDGAQLVLLLAKRKYRSNQGEKALEDLVLKSAEKISVEATAAVQEVKTWQLPANITIPAGLPKDVAMFLRSPCQQSLSYRLAKKNHKGLAALLGSFIRANVLKVTSYQPTGNYWHVKLEKLQQRLTRATEASGCSCVTGSSSFGFGGYASDSSLNSGYSFGQSSSQGQTCLFASIKTNLESQKKAAALLNQLLPHLPADARSEFRKRKGFPEPICNQALSTKKAKESVDVVYLT